MSTVEDPAARLAGGPPHRYTAELAQEIELRWQTHWDEQGTYHAPNPSGLLSEGAERVAGRPPLFVLDMFPYPSGAGLHVGHPLGYIGTDVFSRFKRMTGFNVLYSLGYDAFGLPAEQHAIATGVHPRVNTESNIANMRRQLHRLGLGHDLRRSVATTDEAVLPVDAMDLPAGLQQLVRRGGGPGAAHRRADRLEFESGDQGHAERRSVGFAVRTGAEPDHRRAIAWRTCPRRRSTGARGWARSSPTRR